MPKFTDSLRGYAFETMQRDGFKCRYCGLEGTASFANWLALSEDHLLPKGHPERNNRGFIVCACRFCNGADNRYFGQASVRGISITGLTADDLIELKRSFVEATRQRYREFWEANVKGVDGHGASTSPTTEDVGALKRRFVREIARVTSFEQAAANAIVAALQHNPTYLSSNVDGKHFRAAFVGQLRKHHDRYAQAVGDDEHCAVIEEIVQTLSAAFGPILNARRLRVGTVQKALNLYLKTVWCMDSDRALPPHCPVDRIVLEQAGISANWTQLDSIVTYGEWIARLRIRAGPKSLSEWELALWQAQVVRGRPR